MTERSTRLVEHVRAIGEYLAENAEQIVGRHEAAGISGLSITCDFSGLVGGSCEIPTVKVSKELITNKTVDVLEMGGR